MPSRQTVNHLTLASSHSASEKMTVSTKLILNFDTPMQSLTFIFRNPRLVSDQEVERSSLEHGVHEKAIIVLYFAVCPWALLSADDVAWLNQIETNYKRGFCALTVGLA